MGLGCIFLEWVGWYEGMVREDADKILRVVEMGVYLKSERG
jgi:hypothetical protein